MPKTPVIEKLIVCADAAVGALYDYVRTLEDAYSELAEPLDKKLKAMEKAVKNLDKPIQKKEQAEKPSYIK